MAFTTIADSTERVVKVATYGLDHGSIKMLALTFDKRYRGLIELVNSADAADVLLIDLDSKVADALLKSHLHNKKPIIVMSIGHKSIENTVYIRKPINIPVLLKTIRELTLGVSPEEINKKLPLPPKPIAVKSIKIDTKLQAKKPDSKIKTTARALNGRVEDNTAAVPVMKRSGVTKSIKTDTKLQAKKPDSNIKTTARALNEQVEDNTAAVPVMKRSGVTKSIKIDTKLQAKKPDSNIKTTARALNGRVEDNTAAALVMRRSGVTKFAGLYYKQDDHVLGYLLRAVELARSQSACVKLTCWNKPFIVFNPARNEEILTNLSDGMIRSLGVMRTTGEELPIESNVMTAKEFSALLKDNVDSMELFPAQVFIWKLTLLTARGRVPEGTDLMQPVFLQHWPNMTRLDHIPHGLRIAALWSKQPRSLLSMFAVLGIPFDHILNLYSATNAIGLAGQTNRKVDALIEPDGLNEHRHRGLFSSLLHKLSGRKAT